MQQYGEAPPDGSADVDAGDPQVNGEVSGALTVNSTTHKRSDTEEEDFDEEVGISKKKQWQLWKKVDVKIFF